MKSYFHNIYRTSSFCTISIYTIDMFHLDCLNRSLNGLLASACLFSLPILPSWFYPHLPEILSKHKVDHGTSFYKLFNISLLHVKDQHFTMFFQELPKSLLTPSAPDTVAFLYRDACTYLKTFKLASLGFECSSLETLLKHNICNNTIPNP